LATIAAEQVQASRPHVSESSQATHLTAVSAHSRRPGLVSVVCRRRTRLLHDPISLSETLFIPHLHAKNSDSLPICTQALTKQQLTSFCDKMCCESSCHGGSCPGGDATSKLVTLSCSYHHRVGSPAALSWRFGSEPPTGANQQKETHKTRVA
jgi:hypothetical protein